MNVLEARDKLGKTQQQIAKASGWTQKQISNMEQGRTPVDPQYAAWLGQQLVQRYKRIADMPSLMLGQLIRERKEI